MKNKKLIGIICSILIIILIALLLIFRGYFGKEKQENIVTPSVSSVSKNTAFQQASFIDLFRSDDFGNLIKNDHFSLDSLAFNESFKDCSGEVNFHNNNLNLKLWDYRTSCGESQNNMISKFATTSNENMSIKVFEPVKAGYLSVSQIENNNLEIAILDDSFNAVWRKNLKSNDGIETHLTPFDILEVDDGYYILGLATNVSGAEFESIVKDYEHFSFLAKYDLKGNLISLLNLQDLSSQDIAIVSSLIKGKNGKLYLSSRDNILVLDEKNKLQVINILEDHILADITSDSYYTYQNTYKNIDNDEDETQIVNVDSSIEVYDWNNKKLKSVNTLDFRKCGGEDCYIKNVYVVSDFILIEFRNQIYILDKDFKIIKALDYENVKQENSDKEYENVYIHKIIVSLNSYIVISSFDNQYLSVEEYDYSHNKIQSKVFDAAELILILQDANENYFQYNNQKLIIDSFINDDFDAFVFTEVLF